MSVLSDCLGAASDMLARERWGRRGNILPSSKYPGIGMIEPPAEGPIVASGKLPDLGRSGNVRPSAVGFLRPPTVTISMPTGPDPVAK